MKSKKADTRGVRRSAGVVRMRQIAGIYVVQINMVSTQKTDAYVGGDWLGLGSAIARDLVKTCGKGAGKSGKVVIVQGPPTAAADFDQYNGLKAVLEQSKSESTIVCDQSAGPLWS